MATDFRSILATTADTIEKPKPVPVGTYHATVLAWEPTESAQKKTPGIKVTLQLTGPDSDVDMDQLESIGGMAVVLKRKVTHTFWLTEDSMWRLTEFCSEACKIDMGSRSLAEILPETQHAAVKVVLSHRITEKQDILINVESILPAD